MSKRCWLCGDPANTGEHKVKRSDLERVHGKGPKFASAGLNYLKSDGRVVPLQGPNSAHLKYQGVLCEACNNARTQNFDRAYDQFAAFVEANTEQLLARRQLDFQAVFGKDWREKQGDLFKYFVKSFGCHIADANREVPTDLCGIFDNRYPQLPFAICFAADEDEVAKPRELQTRLGIGHLVQTQGNTTTVRYASANRYRWLLITYWYNWGPYGPVGEPWHRDQQFVCLGSYTKAGADVQIRRDDGTLVQWPGIEARIDT